MKKTLLYTAMACMGLAFGSCSDYLDTFPTKNPPATEIFKDAESARTMINGIYRNFYAAGWSDGWPHENCGLMGIILTADLTGEDHVMYGSGQGWFYYDYLLSTQGDYSHKSGHPYAFWNLLYTNICNANELLAHKETLPGDKNHVKALMAEAYAVRALVLSLPDSNLSANLCGQRRQTGSSGIYSANRQNHSGCSTRNHARHIQAHQRGYRLSLGPV